MKSCASDSDNDSSGFPQDGFIRVVGRRGRKKKACSASQPTFNTDSPSGGCNVALELCVFCNTATDDATSLQCRACTHFYHLSCCGLDPSMFESAAAICKLIRWKCAACELESENTVHRLREDIEFLRV